MRAARQACKFLDFFRLPLPVKCGGGGGSSSIIGSTTISGRSSIGGYSCVRPVMSSSCTNRCGSDASSRGSSSSNGLCLHEGGEGEGEGEGCRGGAVGGVQFRAADGRLVGPLRLLMIDCDGVIFDSNRLKTAAYRRTLEKMSVPPDKVDDFEALHLADVSISRFVKFRRFFTEVYPVVPAADCDAAVQRALALFSSACEELYAQLTPRTEAIQLAQRFDVAYVVSGGAETELQTVFKNSGIDIYFARVCGSPTKKPDHVARILSETGFVPRDCLFVGDGLTDFRTATTAGIEFAFLEEMSDWDYSPGALKHTAGPAGVTVCPNWQDLLARTKPTTI